MCRESSCVGFTESSKKKSKNKKSGMDELQKFRNTRMVYVDTCLGNLLKDSLSEP